MATTGKVISDQLIPSSLQTRPTQAERTGSTEFESSLLDTAAPLEPQIDRPITEEEAAGFSSESSRRRALEELRTLVRAIQGGVTDPFQLTDLVFYARHPDLYGAPLTREQQPLLDEWNSISALLVHPTLNEVGNILGADIIGGDLPGAELLSSFGRFSSSDLNVPGGATRRFDSLILNAVQWCPGLSPSILKSLLAQESNFNTTVINEYGYAGIAQFGRTAAREAGLQVGVAGTENDERLNPQKAIPAAARLLNLKAQRLGELAFSRYGQPEGIEFWKFVLAAYNGGEGTITLAMGRAYREGMDQARSAGLVGYEALSFARGYASQWENLRAGGEASPLALAAARYFPSLALAKYYEIANYPTAIVARSLHAKATARVNA